MHEYDDKFIRHSASCTFIRTGISYKGVNFPISLDSSVELLLMLFSKLGCKNVCNDHFCTFAEFMLATNKPVRLRCGEAQLEDEKQA